MKIECIHIEDLIQIVNLSHSDIKDVSKGWSKVKQVVHMKKKLSNGQREKIAEEKPSLNHWVSKKTPHNPAEEGYTCNSCNVAIAFPLD